MNVFAANRLTVARGRRKFTKKMLAEAVGVTGQAITSYEDQSLYPSEDTITRIAFAIDYPRTFFLLPDLELVGHEDATFRARRALKANNKYKAIATGVIATEILSVYLRSQFRFAVSDVPDLTGEEPEVAARIVRQHWKLGSGPIHNMVHLLESRGVELYWLNEEDSCLDAFSLWRGELPYVILNTHKQAGDRSRFDAAHELGHLVLHRQEKIVDGRKPEAEADQFASAFLLPSEQFRRESPRLPVLNQYLPLKRRWGVSIQAMVRRGRDLGVFTDWYYEQAIKQLSTLGWRIDEPAPLICEKSLLHNMVFDRLAAKQITPAQLAQSLHLPFSDITEIMPCAKDFVPIDRLSNRNHDEGTERIYGDLVLKIY